MIVNVFAFKGAEKNLVVRTNEPLKIDLTSNESVTITDDSTRAWIDINPRNILYISSGDEEVMNKRLEEIRRAQKTKELKAQRKPKNLKIN